MFVGNQGGLGDVNENDVKDRVVRTRSEMSVFSGDIGIGPVEIDGLKGKLSGCPSDYGQGHKRIPGVSDAEL